jgi:hypothetical protein
MNREQKLAAVFLALLFFLIGADAGAILYRYMHPAVVCVK